MLTESETIDESKEEKHADEIGQRNSVQDSLLDEGLHISSLWSLPLTGFNDQKVVALSQKAFSEKRQKQRVAFFTDIDTDGHQGSSRAGPKYIMQEESRVCPILLLKQSHLRSSSSGWSLIIPIGWVHAFWVPLVFAGGHVLGLREYHWLSTDAGIPFFPHDFPDCPAYAQHLAAESTSFDVTNNLRPPSKRAPPFIVSPLQRSILNVYESNMADGIVKKSGAPAEPTSEHDSGHNTLERGTTGDTTNRSGTTEITILDNTVVTEANNTPLVLHSSQPSAGSVNQDGDSKMTDTGSAVPGVVILPSGTSEYSILDSTGVTEAGAPSVLYSSQASLDSDDRAGVLESRNQDGDTKTTNTGSGVPVVANLQSGTFELMVWNRTAVAESGVPAVLYPLQISNIASIPESRNQDGDTKMIDTGSALPGLETLLSDTSEFTFLDNTAVTAETLDISNIASIPELRNKDGDTKMIDTGSALPGLETMQSDTLEFTILDNTAVTVAGTPSVFYPLQSSLDSADSATGPELKNQDGCIKITDINCGVPLVAVSPLSSDRETIQARIFHDDTASAEDSRIASVHCSSVVCQSEQTISYAPASQHVDADKSALAVQVLSAEETGASKPVATHDFQAPEIGKTGFDSNQSSEPPPNSIEHDCVGEQPQRIDTADKERLRLSFFVVRNLDTLMKTLKENGSLHALIQIPDWKKWGNVRDGLRQGRLEWRVSHEPAETPSNQICTVVGGHKRTCYVRVLLVTPRKGVTRENDFLQAPMKEDFDAFLSRSQHWRGDQTSRVQQKVKDPRKRKQKEKKLVKSADCPSVEEETRIGGFADTAKGLENAGYECQ